MATFEYQALTSSGRLMKGTVEAPSNEQATDMLRQMQLTVNSLTAAKPEKPHSAVGRNEFILFNQQLASITKAGIPLERGLRELSADVGSRSMRRLIEEVVGDLEKGVSIEQAFGSREKRFPTLYGRIVEAGVQSGRLSEMLISLNRHLEAAQQTRRIIFEAICYPAVILALAAVILTFIYAIIVPQMRGIFLEFDIELPLITVAVLTMADHVIPFWTGVAGIIVGLLLLKLMLSTSKKGRRLTESVLLRLPIIGRIHLHGILSRLADAMALLIGSGSDIPASLRLGAETTGSEILKAECDALARQMEEGVSLMEAGQFATTIPKLFLYSMQLGAQRDELQDNLYSLSDMHVQQIRFGQSRLSALLLPLMLILLGGFIGFLLIALIAPLVSIVSNM